MSLLETHCPSCRNPFPADALKRLGGLCLACLSDFALEGEPSGGSEAGGPPRDLPLQVGATFRSFQLIEVIGWGGMGVVYKARQEDLNRFVALKVINTTLASDREFARRFNGEAKALAALNHPNIVQVFDFGKEGSLYYLVMEFVEGASLRHLIGGGRVNAPEALKIATQICTALEYAHSQGVIHRDIKPENILINGQGMVKIADFGLAKVVDGTEGNAITRQSQVLGTLHYIAPELLAREPADHRADIYSLGVLFYEMLTGEVPLGRFAPPSKRVRLDVRVDEVVLKALEREPAKRYARAADLKTRVEWLRLPPLRRRLFRPLSLALAMTLTAGLVGGVLLMNRRPAAGPGPAVSPPSSIDRWSWENRGDITETRGIEFAVPAYRDVPLMTARADDHELGKNFALRFKLRYEVQPKDEPWIMVIFDGPDGGENGSKMLVLFPEADHVVALADLLPAGPFRLLNRQPLPKVGPKPGQWHEIEIAWVGARRHLQMKVDGERAFEGLLRESDDLSGSWRFGFGGAAKEIRIRQVHVAGIH